MWLSFIRVLRMKVWKEEEKQFPCKKMKFPDLYKNFLELNILSQIACLKIIYDNPRESKKYEWVFFTK